MTQISLSTPSHIERQPLARTTASENASTLLTATIAKLTAWVEVLETMAERRRQRRQLLSFGEFGLKDMGISSASADGEGAKYFWRK